MEFGKSHPHRRHNDPVLHSGKTIVRRVVDRYQENIEFDWLLLDLGQNDLGLRLCILSGLSLVGRFLHYILSDWLDRPLEHNILDLLQNR